MMSAKYFEYYTIMLRGPFFRGHTEGKPAKLLDHVLRVASDPSWKFDGVDAAHNQRVRLHWVRPGERWAATHQHASQSFTARRHAKARYTRLLDNSRIRQLADCQLADWTSRGLVNSWTRQLADYSTCLLYTSPSPRDRQKSRMPSSA